MTQSQMKSVEELLAMSSAEVRAYLQTLSASERKIVIKELYKAQLRLDMQKNEQYSDSQNKSQ